MWSTLELSAIYAHSVLPMLIRKTGKYILSTPCIYEVKINEIMVVQKSQLVMLPIVYLKSKDETDQVSVTLINLSNDEMNLAKCGLDGTLKFYADYEEIQNLKFHQLVAEQQTDMLPCTPPDTKPVCSPGEFGTNRKL